MSDSDGPDAFDEIFDEDFVNGLDASHDDDSDIHVITAPPTNLFRFDEPEDEVLQGHPSRSSGYVDPLINDQYLYGHRLFDLTALRLKDFTKPSVAAEKVWDIPELRLIIVENVAGPKEKSTLRNILLTDKRGFGAAMPVLYRSMLDELHSYICYMNSPPDRRILYTQAVQELWHATFQNRLPLLPGSFVRYLDTYPNLQRLRAVFHGVPWVITRTMQGETEHYSFDVEILVNGRIAVAENGAGLGDEAGPVRLRGMLERDYSAALEVAGRCGLTLRSFSMVLADGAIPTSIYRNLQHMLEDTSITNLEYLNTGSLGICDYDLVYLARACPNLRTLVCHFCPDPEDSWFRDAERSTPANTAAPPPPFPKLQKLVVLDFWGWKLQAHARTPLSESRFPALREVTVPSVAAAYFGFGVLHETDGAPPNGRLESPVRHTRLEAVTFIGLAQADHSHPFLRYINVINATVSPTCQLYSHNPRMKGFSEKPFSERSAQWFRSLLQLREDLRFGGRTETEPGWRHVPKQGENLVVSEDVD